MANPLVNVKDVIKNFYEQFIDNTNIDSPFKPNQGVVFSIHLSHIHHGYNKDGSEHFDGWEGSSMSIVYILITANKNVFYANHKDEKGQIVLDYNLIPASKWVNTSNHDSCWHTDGFSQLSQDDFKIYEEANKNVPLEFRPSYNEACKHIQLGHGICNSKLVKFIEVEFGGPDKTYPNRHTLKFIKPMEGFKLTLV